MSNDGSIKMMVNEIMYYKDMDYAEALEEGTRFINQLESAYDENYDDWE